MDDIQPGKNFKINSKALVKNLEDSEKKLKGGATIKESLTEADIMWYNMNDEQRAHIIDSLEPKPTDEYNEKLKSLMDTYDTSER